MALLKWTTHMKHILVCIYIGMVFLQLCPVVYSEDIKLTSNQEISKESKDQKPVNQIFDKKEKRSDVEVGAQKKDDVDSLGAKSKDLGFAHAFVASLSVIIVSELGDKTFFIAAIMAMRHSRVTVFAAAITALGAMTVLSAILGYATTVIPRSVTYYISSGLFALFGLKMLKDELLALYQKSAIGWEMSPDEGQEEFEEVQADLRRRDDELQKQNMQTQDIETGIIRTPGRRFLSKIMSRIFLQALSLTFLAEWGDRSQITTIILGAREDVYGVIIGGTLGHALCTGLAVLGGRFIAQKISVRTVTLVGGVVFLIFALSAFFIKPAE